MFPVTVGLVLATLLTIHVLPQLASVLLLVFAGIILAVMLDALTSALGRVLPLGHGLAYATALASVVLVLAGIGLLIGPQLQTQIPQLIDQIPQAWHKMLAQLSDWGVLGEVSDKAAQSLQSLAVNNQLMKLASGTFGALVNIFVVLFVGLYGAAAPQRYLHFGRRLMSEQRQRQTAALASDLGSALRYWMLGRALTLAIVGIASGLGLWLLGVPLAFTLGLIAGVLSFIPYLGPILGLIPALLIAVVESPMLAGWVLLLYGGVHLAESALLTPLIQQRAIAMPPAILITAQLVGGVLIGPLGVLLAAPLVVCGLVAAGWQRTDETAQ